MNFSTIKNFLGIGNAAKADGLSSKMMGKISPVSTSDFKQVLESNMNPVKDAPLYSKSMGVKQGVIQTHGLEVAIKYDKSILDHKSNQINGKEKSGWKSVKKQSYIVGAQEDLGKSTIGVKLTEESILGEKTSAKKGIPVVGEKVNQAEPQKITLTSSQEKPVLTTKSESKPVDLVQEKSNPLNLKEAKTKVNDEAPKGSESLKSDGQKVEINPNASKETRASIFNHKETKTEDKSSAKVQVKSALVDDVSKDKTSSKPSVFNHKSSDVTKNETSPKTEYKSGFKVAVENQTGSKTPRLLNEKPTLAQSKESSKTEDKSEFKVAVENQTAQKPTSSSNEKTILAQTKESLVEKLVVEKQPKTSNQVDVKTEFKDAVSTIKGQVIGSETAKKAEISVKPKQEIIEKGPEVEQKKVKVNDSNQQKKSPKELVHDSEIISKLDVGSTLSASKKGLSGSVIDKKELLTKSENEAVKQPVTSKKVVTKDAKTSQNVLETQVSSVNTKVSHPIPKQEKVVEKQTLAQAKLKILGEESKEVQTESSPKIIGKKAGIQTESIATKSGITSGKAKVQENSFAKPKIDSVNTNAKSTVLDGEKPPKSPISDSSIPFESKSVSSSKTGEIKETVAQNPQKSVNGNQNKGSEKASIDLQAKATVVENTKQETSKVITQDSTVKTSSKPEKGIETPLVSKNNETQKVASPIAESTKSVGLKPQENAKVIRQDSTVKTSSKPEKGIETPLVSKNNETQKVASPVAEPTKSVGLKPQETSKVITQDSTVKPSSKPEKGIETPLVSKNNETQKVASPIAESTKSVGLKPQENAKVVRQDSTVKPSSKPEKGIETPLVSKNNETQKVASPVAEPTKSVGLKPQETSKVITQDSTVKTSSKPEKGIETPLVSKNNETQKVEPTKLEVKSNLTEKAGNEIKTEPISSVEKGKNTLVLSSAETPKSEKSAPVSSIQSEVKSDKVEELPKLINSKVSQAKTEVSAKANDVAKGNQTPTKQLDLVESKTQITEPIKVAKETIVAETKPSETISKKESKAQPAVSKTENDKKTELDSKKNQLEEVKSTKVESENIPIKTAEIAPKSEIEFDKEIKPKNEISQNPIAQATAVAAISDVAKPKSAEVTSKQKNSELQKSNPISSPAIPEKAPLVEAVQSQVEKAKTEIPSDVKSGLSTSVFVHKHQEKQTTADPKDVIKRSSYFGQSRRDDVPVSSKSENEPRLFNSESRAVAQSVEPVMKQENVTAQKGELSGQSTPQQMSSKPHETDKKPFQLKQEKQDYIANGSKPAESKSEFARPKETSTSNVLPTNTPVEEQKQEKIQELVSTKVEHQNMEQTSLNANIRKDFPVKMAQFVRNMPQNEPTKTAELWHKHRFISEEGQALNIAVRKNADGTIQMQINGGSPELTKVIQQHVQEIRENLQQRLEVRVDIQFNQPDQGGSKGRQGTEQSDKSPGVGKLTGLKELEVETETAAVGNRGKLRATELVENQWTA